MRHSILHSTFCSLSGTIHKHNKHRHEASQVKRHTCSSMQSHSYPRPAKSTGNNRTFPGCWRSATAAAINTTTTTTQHRAVKCTCSSSTVSPTSPSRQTGLVWYRLASHVSATPSPSLASRAAGAGVLHGSTLRPEPSNSLTY